MTDCNTHLVRFPVYIDGHRRLDAGELRWCRTHNQPHEICRLERDGL